jgi:hypothetical protein
VYGYNKEKKKEEEEKSEHQPKLQTDGKKNSVVLVRERTISTERPPLVGEVSANFCG